MSEASFTAHFLELKRRVLIALAAFGLASLACYFIAPHILSFIIKPLAEQGGTRLIYTELTEAFVTYIKIACVAGFAVASPLIFAQVWLFIAPGLYAHEKKSVVPFFFASPLLFLGGMALVYWFIMPAAWHFFLAFQTSATETALPIHLEARMGEYLNLVLSLFFAFGLCFQLPVALVLMGRVGLVTKQSLKRLRRYMIVAAFAVAAVLTPPDVFSQLMLAVPLILLYELSIFFVPNAPQPTVPAKA